jgi:hypothetical protein
VPHPFAFFLAKGWDTSATNIPRMFLLLYPSGASRMNINSPFFVVPVIIVVFVVCILFGTSSKEDGSPSH